MARLPRVYVEGAIYYVTCRGHFNEKLFKEKRDYLMYAELLEKYRDEFKFKLFAYVLLPQHLHLLIEPSPEFEISDIMRSLNTAYSKYFNNAYTRRGHLFRERFKACIVEKKPFLLKVTSYIHNNPVRMDLAHDPEAYPYSSFYLYTEGQNQHDEIKEVLSYLKNTEYPIYTKETEAENALLHKKLTRGGIFGSKEFIKKVKEEIAHLHQEPKEIKQGPARQYVYVGVGLGVLILFGLIGVANLLKVKEEKETVVKKKIEQEALVVRTISDLKGTEWEVVFVPIKGGEKFQDILRFLGGKFISSYLSQKGYTPTNYSAMQEKSKIIWETIQSYQGQTASWRGEVSATSMRGILSLRSEDQTQDFSFKSISLRRR